MQRITWWPGDYLRDTGDLSLVEHGAYRVLLDHYYSTDGRLRADEASLFRICRAMTEEEQAAVGKVVRLFFTVDANLNLHNKKADEIIAENREFVRKAEEAGRKGSAKRWGKANPVGNPIATPLGGGCGAEGGAWDVAAKRAENDKKHPGNMGNPMANPMGYPMQTPIASTTTINTKEGGQARPDLEFIFREGVDSLLAGGLNEREARAVLGKMVKDFGEAETATALQAAIGKADVKTYALAILTKKRREAKEQKRFVI